METLIPFSVSVSPYKGIEVDMSSSSCERVLVDKEGCCVRDVSQAVAALGYALDYDECYVDLYEDITIDDMSSLVKSLNNEILDERDPEHHAESVLWTLIAEQHDDFVSDVASELAEEVEKKLFESRLVPFFKQEWDEHYYSLRSLKYDEEINVEHLKKFSEWFAQEYTQRLARKPWSRFPKFILEENDYEDEEDDVKGDENK